MKIINNMKNIVLIISVLLGCNGLLHAQLPELVKDINTISNLNEPKNLTDLNGVLYFVKDDDIHGEELWKTDGTAAGTELVKDINPGLESSIIYGLTKVSNILYFVAYRPSEGFALWKTEGTAANTVMVKDINLFSTSQYDSGIYSLTDVNGILMFVANDGTTGNELWKSDGTATGTVLVKDIFPGPTGSSIADLINVNGNLFFRAESSTNNRELWTSSGTDASTSLRANINPSSSSFPSNFNVIFSSGSYFLYFTADNGTNGREVYRLSLSVAGSTPLLYDINPGFAGSNPINFKVIAGAILYFSANEPTFGIEVYRLTPAITPTRLTDINPNAGNSFPSEFFNYGADVYFLAYNPLTGHELYKNNGTTSTLIEINSGAESSNPNSFTILNGQMYFFVSKESTLESKLMKIPAFGGSPQLVKTIVDSYFFESFSSLSSSYYDHIEVSNNLLFFVAVDNINGLNLWKTDGTNTIIVKDSSPGSSNCTNFLSAGATTFFFADNFTNGKELWKTDGTSGGTALVKDIRPGSLGYNGYYEKGIEFNNKILFNVTNFFFDSQTWISDGTNAGTIPLLDNNGLPVSAFNFILFQNMVFFTSNGELWKTDGSPGGTYSIGYISDGIINYVIKNNELFIITNIDLNVQIFKTNGISISLIETIPNLYYLGSGIFKVGNTYCFTATNATFGQEIWKTDLAAGTTSLLKDIKTGSTNGLANSSKPQELVSDGTTLYFSAENNDNGRELWKSTGTTAGTEMVKNIQPDLFINLQIVGGSSFPENLKLVGNTLYFSTIQNNLFGANYGRELWKSDGSDIGTVLVKDINPSFAANGLAANDETYGKKLSFTNVGNTLYFTANAGYGFQLWKTQGTATTTEQLTGNFLGLGYRDYVPAFTELTSNNNQIFFNGVTDTQGVELFKFVHCPSNLSLTGSFFAQQRTHQASQTITSTGSLIFSSNITLQAGKSVTLLPGFEAKLGGLNGTGFKAQIGGCN
jgi:trimeric autotransporter adhesin